MFRVFRQPVSLSSSISRRLLSSSTVIGSASSKTVVPQSSNRTEVWSNKQQPRSEAMSGPRFEQTNFDLQPNPPSAIELIARVPVKMVHGRKASCDGGGGALGHPKVYINLDEGVPIACGYCGLRYQQEPHHH